MAEISSILVPILL